jgi:exodeoxyribonuclease VII large subunit
LLALKFVSPDLPPRHVLAPAQLNALSRELLENTLGTVWIEGELGGVSRPASGHLYFALKDARAQVRCALFKPKSQWLSFRPTDGMAVLARGRVSLYEPRGEYQLIVDHLEEAGEGALRRAFEELKARLLAEGLFATERKRPLPPHIARIGVLSSPSGAAVHDVLTVLRRRFPLLEVELLPVPVQGAQAASEIARILARADQSQRYDVLLITRGGGSLEDLAAFNDEALARAVAACETVVVSAVGHEVDISICDLVADLRAATPSAAAELLSPDGDVLQKQLARLRQHLEQSLQRKQENLWLRLDPLQHRLSAQHPSARLQRGRERLATLRQRFQLFWRQDATARRANLGTLQMRLQPQAPGRQLPVMRTRNGNALARLRRALDHHLANTRARTELLARALHAVSPLATLDRGYALLLDDQDNVIRSVDALNVGQSARARLRDGKCALQVTSIEPRGEAS